ncbi:FAD dependent oxidoreductase [Roseimicrobium gellanilyticum]|uniref:FAD dependent oxidoreductase n=1 Tax=Roseimicrobium gellanilyticum TaxID=748857 RepID=A0A366HVK0_9BACT|nr:FAD-dependent oxidoreductase [Roseimicrobium gellanilyticum]RBP47900.1 FAD dependent oxidoreductase [Roseimicrobium gellanilyticum]
MKRLLLAAILPLTWSPLHAKPTFREADVCVYGATPAGITAAVAAKQEGLSVVLIEPSRWVGGILGAGIKPMQDCPEPRAVGGLTTTKIFKAGNSPPQIRESFSQWLKDEGIPIIFEHRLRSADKEGARITKIHLDHAPPDKWGIPVPSAVDDSNTIVTAKVFIDASYEGDFLPAAKVSYTSGREPKDKFNESVAGVGPPTNWTPISPFITPGDPASGMLPWVDKDHGKPRHAGDDYTQAYNFRFYVTSDPEKRAALTPPDDYNPAQYELVGRYVEHLVKTQGSDAKKLKESLAGIFPGWRNEGEYNYQRKSLVTMSPLGISRFYQDGDWITKSKVWRQHVDYLRGLHHFLSTDARVPEDFRKETAALGLNKTMHPDTEGWPHQLYVRISRRMQSDYILTHADVLNKTDEKDGVGLALYGVDIYPVRRYVALHPETEELGVATEGNMFIGGAKGTGHPYPVPYRSIVPKTSECTNLIVPTCFSASFIAYASARMEPVFCVLGESSGVAAAHAIRANADVQSIDVPKLQARLLERGQVIAWKADAGDKKEAKQ